MKNQKQLAHLALLGANLLYGAGFSVAKSIMPSYIQPRGFILIRVGITAILFWCSWLLGKNYREKIEKKDWGRLVLCAALGIATNQLLFFMGLSLTTPIHASLIMLSTPILVTFIAAYFAKEKITIPKILGLALACFGACLLIFARSTEAIASNGSLGDLFVLLNACSYALYLVLVKPLMHQYRPIVVIRWLFAIGFVFVLPFGSAQFMQINWASFQQAQWMALVFIVMGVTFFTYLWNIYALKVLDSSVAGAYIYLQPIFAAIISMLFLKEEFTIQKGIAAVCIFLGVSIGTGLLKKMKA
jgi:drug/metabolite transporter (DMT)-like permease